MNNPKALKEELKGRSIFKELADLIGWLVEFTKEEYNPIDLYLTITEHKNGLIYTASGEIKNRALSTIRYKTHIITLHKIVHLMKDRKDFAMFINIIGNDIFIYDCKKLVRLMKEGKLKPYKKRLPNNNMAGTDYHYEYVVEVDKDTAIHFKKDKELWSRV